MPVAIIVDFSATIEQYDEVSRRLEAYGEPPAGLIIHTGAQTEDGMRAIDIWESEQDYQSFREQRLGPAVAEVMGEDAGTPNIQVHELHDVVKP